MKAVISPLAGVCVCESEKSIAVIKIDGEKVPPNKAHLLYGVMQDWCEVEAPSIHAALEIAKSKHTCRQILLYIHSCLYGVPDTLQSRVLLEVERLFASGTFTDQVSSQLLIAPLRAPMKLAAIGSAALAMGCGVTARIVDTVVTVQPILRRLLDKWMSIPDVYYSLFPGGRHAIWSTAAEDGLIYRTIQAQSRDDVEQVWAALVFNARNSSERSALSAIAGKIAAALFDYEGRVVDYSRMRSDDAGAGDEPVEMALPTYGQVIRQIESISELVSAGQDSRARKYLNELVHKQTVLSENTGYAVKTLCNVAKLCDEMFRPDFSIECLRAAMQIQPDDGWTAIQLANQYKDLGIFDQAIAVLSPVNYDNRLVSSTRADIYSRMGDFSKAIKTYMNVSGYEYDDVVRGGVADTLRRWGYLDAAQTAYENMAELGMGGHRIESGLAEIAKQRGQFESAKLRYLRILGSPILDASSRIIYSVAVANVYLRMNDLTSAYKILQTVVQERPHFQQARMFLTVVEGMLGNLSRVGDALSALQGSPESIAWSRQYVQGLLLLLLDRYADAKKCIELAVAQGPKSDDRLKVLQIAAAILMLRTQGGTVDASNILSEVSPSYDDDFAQAIIVLLKYHLAAMRRNEVQMATLSTRLAKSTDADVQQAADAIRRKEWNMASKSEMRALLRFAIAA